MTRRIAFIFGFTLFLGVGAFGRAQSRPLTLVIENVGVSDEVIIPIVISNSETGIASGRKIILEDTGLDVVVTHVVSADAFSRIVDPIQKAEDDGTKSLKAFGTLRFVILSEGKIVRSIFLGRENGIKILVSLESIAGSGVLQKDLAYLRYQVTTVAGQKGGWPRRERGRNGDRRDWTGGTKEKHGDRRNVPQFMKGYATEVRLSWRGSGAALLGRPPF